MAQSSWCEAAGDVLCVAPPSEGRLIVADHIRNSEIIAALSVALDITQGNPEGHCMRSALIGMRLAEELHLSQADCSALFYALLLKDLGCSSNAAKITYLFGADDHRVKRSIRMSDWSKAGDSLKNCWGQCAPGGSVIEKLMRMAYMARSGIEGAKKLSKVRCERGADIARMLQLPEATARAILDLDEHWNGNGHPCGLKKQEISLLGRICCLAQTVEVFFTAFGLALAIDVAHRRRGQTSSASIASPRLLPQSSTPRALGRINTPRGLPKSRLASRSSSVAPRSCSAICGVWPCYTILASWACRI